MIIYKRCSEIDISLAFSAFEIGFSDYIIKLQMPKELFVERFFGPEGNSLEYSFVALDGEKPIGIILGGIKEYEGVKTMRCGTLAVAPEYRGKGISQKLMELHRETAVKAGCKQLFLEVIVGNDRAINFYKKLGYEKIYNLSYYTLENLNNLSRNCSLQLAVLPIEVEDIRRIASSFSDVHINWQNDLDYIEKLQGQKNLGAFIGHKLIGAIIASKTGKVSFIWVDKSLRHNRIASRLMQITAEELKLSKIALSFPNNASLQGFANRLGFTKDQVSQYEMYLTLK